MKAPTIHAGDEVTVHSGASRFNNRDALAEFPDAEGGYEVSIDGQLLHFELSELAPRRPIGTGGGAAS